MVNSCHSVTPHPLGSRFTHQLLLTFSVLCALGLSDFISQERQDAVFTPPYRNPEPRGSH